MKVERRTKDRTQSVHKCGNVSNPRPRGGVCEAENECTKWEATASVSGGL